MTCPYCKLNGHKIEKEFMGFEYDLYRYKCPRCGDSHRENLMDATIDHFKDVKEVKNG